MLALFLHGLIIVGGALAFSRGAAVGFLMMILIMVFLRYIKFSQLVLLCLGLTWSFGCFLSTLLALQHWVRFTTLASSDSGGATLSGSDGAIRGRATDMLSALLIFNDHPLFGVGPGMVQFYTQDYSRELGMRYLENNPQAHSLFPGIAAESGISRFDLFCIDTFHSPPRFGSDAQKMDSESP